MSRNDRTKAHSELVAAIRKELGREKDLALYLNTKGRLKNVGGQSMYVTDPALGVGTPDLVGILAVECRSFVMRDVITLGRWFCLEVKTGDAVLSQEQKLFRDMSRAKGCFFAEVRSVADAVAALQRARLGQYE